jgi:ankyrin repeat protein
VSTRALPGALCQARFVDQRIVELANQAFDAARSGLTEALVQLVRSGVPVNLCDQNGDTLVMLAAYHGHADTVTALVDNGADVNRANDRGQTPLVGALFTAEDGVVRALLRGGADPHAGQPSAVDTARMLGRHDLLALFEGPE